MKASNISKEILKDVAFIQATLESGVRPTIATCVKVQVMTSPSMPLIAQRTIQIEREDGSPFANANEARQELYKQPIRNVLDDLGFSPKLSNNAGRFHQALVDFTKGDFSPINRDAVTQVASNAQIDETELDNVLAELDGMKIDCHAGGMITLQPEGY